LPLFVLGIRANYSHHPAAVNNLAVVAHFFDRCPDFHTLARP
jgi:hypothetical protein